MYYDPSIKKNFQYSLHHVNIPFIGTGVPGLPSPFLSIQIIVSSGGKTLSSGRLGRVISLVNHNALFKLINYRSNSR